MRTSRLRHHLSGVLDSEYVQPQMSRAREATISKLASLAVKVGALLFILLVPATDVIYFQTAGGVWMINALPALMIALYVKRLNTLSMILGWAAGIGIGTWALVQEKFVTSLHDFGVGGRIYIGLAAIVVNLAVVLVGSLLAALLGRGAPGRLGDDDYRVRRAEDVQVTGTRPPITQPAPGTGG
jgi:SSS family solute:Na+ symporter